MRSVDPTNKTGQHFNYAICNWQSSRRYLSRYPARRNSQKPQIAQINAGNRTATIGAKPKTKLAGPSKSWAIRKIKPTTTPVNTRCPKVTERKGPNTKEIAISTKAAVTTGCKTLTQKANQ